MIRTHGLARSSPVVTDPELAPGSPFAYVADPDGYEFDIWFE